MGAGDRLILSRLSNMKEKIDMIQFIQNPAHRAVWQQGSVWSMFSAVSKDDLPHLT